MKKSWSGARKARLIELWNAGTTSSAIAAEFGDVSRNAVMGMVHRMGLMRSERHAEMSSAKLTGCCAPGWRGSQASGTAALAAADCDPVVLPEHVIAEPSIVGDPIVVPFEMPDVMTAEENVAPVSHESAPPLSHESARSTAELDADSSEIDGLASVDLEANPVVPHLVDASAERVAELKNAADSVVAHDVAHEVDPHQALAPSADDVPSPAVVSANRKASQDPEPLAAIDVAEESGVMPPAIARKRKPVATQPPRRPVARPPSSRPWSTSRMPPRASAAPPLPEVTISSGVMSAIQSPTGSPPDWRDAFGALERLTGIPFDVRVPGHVPALVAIATVMSKGDPRRVLSPQVPEQHVLRFMRRFAEKGMVVAGKPPERWIQDVDDAAFYSEMVALEAA